VTFLFGAGETTMILEKAVNHGEHGDHGEKTKGYMSVIIHLLGGARKISRLPFLRALRVLRGFELRFLG
jgi:hypothetical protein